MLKAKLRLTPLIWVQASFRNLMSSFFHQTPLQKHYEGLAVGIRILRSPFGIYKSLFCPTGLYAFCHAYQPNFQVKIYSLHSCYIGKSRYTGTRERRCWLEAILKIRVKARLLARLHHTPPFGYLSTLFAKLVFFFILLTGGEHL